ncbi:hypothetical protein ECANGB1_745 [Enterospora canceri]|uniref:Ubiquitin-like protease family profile domain-containing protein n=1 Tax=Enterospora canceri TaxID=1081671 RepID=A0A1Y1S893_9MICR|nr:hypothetical protein ECANGB1_745 [Enterospora canceri]
MISAAEGGADDLTTRMAAVSVTEGFEPLPEPHLSLHDLPRAWLDITFESKYQSKPIRNIGSFLACMMGMKMKDEPQCNYKAEDMRSFGFEAWLTSTAMNMYVKRVLKPQCHARKLIINSDCVLHMINEMVPNQEDGLSEFDILLERQIPALELLFILANEAFFYKMDHEGKRVPLESKEEFRGYIDGMDDIFFMMPLTKEGYHWYMTHFNRERKSITLYDGAKLQSHYLEKLACPYVKLRTLSYIVGNENIVHINNTIDRGFKNENTSECGVLVLSFIRDMMLGRCAKKHNMMNMRTILLHELISGEMIYRDYNLPLIEHQER